jgi:hypothetical protein
MAQCSNRIGATSLLKVIGAPSVLENPANANAARIGTNFIGKRIQNLADGVERKASGIYDLRANNLQARDGLFLSLPSHIIG